MVPAAFSTIAEALDVTDQQASYLTTSYTLLGGVTPLLLTPYVNLWGRRPAYLVGYDHWRPFLVPSWLTVVQDLHFDCSWQQHWIRQGCELCRRGHFTLLCWYRFERRHYHRFCFCASSRTWDILQSIDCLTFIDLRHVLPGRTWNIPRLLCSGTDQWSSLWTNCRWLYCIESWLEVDLLCESTLSVVFSKTPRTSRLGITLFAQSASIRDRSQVRLTKR